MTRPKRKTGTREWAEHSVNCCLGGSNGCLYCYARYNALRFGRIASGVDWTTERPVEGVDKERKYVGRVMFPTTHDITPGTEGACLVKLRRLLEAGNTVLVVSKARPALARIIEAAAQTSSAHEGVFQTLNRVELRVTLGTLSADVARFWEPSAPAPGERLKAIEEVRAIGLTVSASMEPLLSPESAEFIVGALINHGCNGEIWIGCANKLRLRTAWCKGVPGLEAEIARLEAWQTPEKMREVYMRLRGHLQIRWKDSYQKVLNIDVMGKALEATLEG